MAPESKLLAYAWPQSIGPGEAFDLHVSSPSPQVDVEVARVGGHRTSVLSRTISDIQHHPLPPDVDAAGAKWPVTATIEAGSDWQSGYYEILLRTDDNGEPIVARAFVVIRSDPRAEAPILLVLSTNTWNAYNDLGGLSLYTGGVQVSFQRPMARGFLYKPPGFGRRVAASHGPDVHRIAHSGYKRVHGLSDWCGSAGWPDWEYPFVSWAEREGYSVDVATNADLQQQPGLLDGHRLMLSVGHDEYWSAPMRTAVESYIAHGGNVAFFSGNTCFWQVRIEDDGRTMVGYKDHFEQDPLYGTERQAEVTTLWSDQIVGNPENTMTGLSMSTGGYARIASRVPAGSGGYTIHRPDHWVFDGTALQYGDVLGAGACIVGYECDGCRFTYIDGLPYPTGEDGTPENFTILATSPAQHFDRKSASRPVQEWEREHMAWRVLGSRSAEAQQRIAHGHAVFGTYTQVGTVVSVGCTEWAHGLRVHDPHVEQVTRNILDRLSA